MYEFMNKKHVNGISYKPDHELMDEKKNWLNLIPHCQIHEFDMLLDINPASEVCSDTSCIVLAGLS